MGYIQEIKEIFQSYMKMHNLFKSQNTLDPYNTTFKTLSLLESAKHPYNKAKDIPKANNEIVIDTIHYHTIPLSLALYILKQSQLSHSF